MLEQGKTEKRKQAKNAQDLVEEFLANGFEKLGKQSMYNMKNKFCPKKLPAEKKVRADLAQLYSWNHYAPLKWFEHLRRFDDNVQNA
jgi:hypothetical protein